MGTITNACRTARSVFQKWRRGRGKAQLFIVEDGSVPVEGLTEEGIEFWNQLRIYLNDKKDIDESD